MKKYADGGEADYSPRFSEDVYERARKFVADAEAAEKAPKRASKPAPKKRAEEVTDTGDETARLRARSPYQKRKILSSKGLNPNTLLPDSNYAKGGKVRGGGCEQRGKTRGRFV